LEIIAEHGLLFIILAGAFGLFMCWGIGANDVANAMGTSVGSRAITIKQALVIAAIFEFAGAVLAGGDVTDTIRKGIVDQQFTAANPEILVLGMLAALLASAIWVLAATSRGWPVSTTHCIVGAVIGFALVGVGADAVQWGNVSEIAASWVISPGLGGAISFLLMVSIRKLILDTEKPFESAKRWGPAYVFLVGFFISLVTLFKGLEEIHLDLSVRMSFVWALVIGVALSILGWSMIRRVTVDEAADKTFHFASVERVFVPLMIFTACAMAFAHGSNDVANGIGPLAAVLEIVHAGGKVSESAPLPLWILGLGGVGIVAGLATYGHHVIKTIGTNITELTPSRGYCATLGAAVTVVLASRTGLPVSTTHIAVGAVIGVGLARGVGAIDLRVIGGIVMSWIVTLPAGGLLAALIFFGLKSIFT